MFTGLACGPVVNKIRGSLRCVSRSTLRVKCRSIVCIDSLSGGGGRQLPLFREGGQVGVCHFEGVRAIGLLFFLSSILTICST